MNDVMVVTNGIDSCGLSIDIPDDQLDLAAQQLSVVDNAIELAKGDLYILKCRALGVVERSALAGKSREELEHFCDLLGAKRNTVENWAAVCGKWKRGDRVAGMSISHYQQVSGMEREAARQLLLRAQMGDPKTDWAASGVQPAKPWKIWGKRRLQEERKKLEGTYVEKPKVSDTKDAVLNVVDAAVEKLPKAKQAPIRNALKAGIKKEFSNLQNKFKAEVEAASKVERERLIALEEKQKKEKADYVALLEGLSKPITPEEFKSLRQFCHPDKHPGNEAKAAKAYAIVEKIGNQLKLN